MEKSDRRDRIYPTECSDGSRLTSVIRAMVETLVSFAGIAVLVSLTPGPATALVVRSAALHGRREALVVTAGNSTGIFFWALASVLGISALVAASETAFWALKIVGAVVLVVLGIQALRGTKEDAAPERVRRSAYRNGLMTSFANPKLAVFFVALFPQFLSDGDSVLLTTLAMAMLLIAVDLVYFTLLAFVVARAKHAVVGSSLARRIERVTGAVMVALGLRLALERR
jgi:threonine/homoserine/homoserine lactone efflux protein